MNLNKVIQVLSEFEKPTVNGQLVITSSDGRKLFISESEIYLIEDGLVRKLDGSKWEVVFLALRTP